ncbi:MAG: hypothetical protein H7836_14095 [Magnetococcus sp. YQC-3]
MAKKKKTTAGKSGKKKSSTGGGKMAGFVNTNKLIGLAAGAFGNNLIKKIPGTGKMNPKLLSALKIVGGEWLPKQQFAKSALQNDAMRQAAGDALIYEGVKELMAGFGIAGMRQRTKPRGNEFLAVSIEGLDKADEVNADVLAEDEFEIGEEINEDVVNGDDLDTVNEDILGEDDMNEDILGDIDTVNDDVLGDDDM